MPEKNDFYALFNATLHNRAERHGRSWLTWAEARECLGAVYHLPRPLIQPVIRDMQVAGFVHVTRYRVEPNGRVQR